MSDLLECQSDDIDKAMGRMTIRVRQMVLLLLWDHIAGPNPLPLGRDPVSRLVDDSAWELDILAAGPSLFDDAATILCAADYRHEKFIQALNAAQRDIIGRAVNALRAVIEEYEAKAPDGCG